jgi:hypothetical protein
MKIANFKRDADNNVVAILEDDSEVILSAGYIESNKPRVGSEYGPPSVIEEVIEAPVIETPVVEETVVEEDGNDS